MKSGSTSRASIIYKHIHILSIRATNYLLNNISKQCGGDDDDGGRNIEMDQRPDSNVPMGSHYTAI